MCLMSHWPIIFSIGVSPLIRTISLGEIKGKMYELLILGTDNPYDYPNWSTCEQAQCFFLGDFFCPCPSCDIHALLITLKDYMTVWVWKLKLICNLHLYVVPENGCLFFKVWVKSTLSLTYIFCMDFTSGASQ